jgi:DNA-binding CsgD family transcriptional regulator
MRSVTASRQDKRQAALKLLLARLSKQERRVLKRFIEHPNDKAVAQALGKQTQTVRNQIASTLRKLGVKSREELIALVLHVRFRGRPPQFQTSAPRPMPADA